jgi:thiamine transporter ThiT
MGFEVRMLLKVVGSQDQSQVLLDYIIAFYSQLAYGRR